MSRCSKTDVLHIIMVTVGDVLCSGMLETMLEDGDLIVFISTLHGG